MMILVIAKFNALPKVAAATEESAAVCVQLTVKRINGCGCCLVF